MFSNRVLSVIATLALIVAFCAGTVASAQQLTPQYVDQVGAGRYLACDDFKIDAAVSFPQPDYKFESRLPQGFGRKTAQQLGVAGKKFWNEYPGVGGVCVIMNPETVLIYDTVSLKPIYVTGCYRGDEGTDGINRIKEVEVPTVPKPAVRPVYTPPLVIPPIRVESKPVPQQSAELTVIKELANWKREPLTGKFGVDKFCFFTLKSVDGTVNQRQCTDIEGQAKFVVPGGKTYILTEDRASGWKLFWPEGEMRFNLAPGEKRAQHVKNEQVVQEQAPAISCSCKMTGPNSVTSGDGDVKYHIIASCQSNGLNVPVAESDFVGKVMLGNRSLGQFSTNLLVPATSITGLAHGGGVHMAYEGTIKGQQVSACGIDVYPFSAGMPTWGKVAIGGVVTAVVVCAIGSLTNHGFCFSNGGKPACAAGGNGTTPAQAVGGTSASNNGNCIQ